MGRAEEYRPKLSLDQGIEAIQEQQDPYKSIIEKALKPWDVAKNLTPYKPNPLFEGEVVETYLPLPELIATYIENTPVHPYQPRVRVTTGLPASGKSLACAQVRGSVDSLNKSLPEEHTLKSTTITWGETLVKRQQEGKIEGIMGRLTAQDFAGTSQDILAKVFAAAHDGINDIDVQIPLGTADRAMSVAQSLSTLPGSMVLFVVPDMEVRRRSFGLRYDLHSTDDPQTLREIFCNYGYDPKTLPKSNKKLEEFAHHCANTAGIEKLYDEVITEMLRLIQEGKLDTNFTRNALPGTSTKFKRELLEKGLLFLGGFDPIQDEHLAHSCTRLLAEYHAYVAREEWQLDPNQYTVLINQASNDPLKLPKHF